MAHKMPAIRLREMRGKCMFLLYSSVQEYLVPTYQRFYVLPCSPETPSVLGSF